MTETYDVIVIGSGPGGYVAAIRAAQLGLKTACIDKNPALGGTCLNIGCIPSKTLLHASELFRLLSHEGKTYGIEAEKCTYNFRQMMDRKQNVVKSFNEGISFLFKKNKIASFIGTGTLTSPTTVDVQNGSAKQTLTARYFILATGSEPLALPFLPFDEKRIVSSTGALSLEKVPKKMLVIGAGVIGVELGSVYSRLGAEVTFIEFLDKICPTFDDSISKALQQILTQQGMHFHLSSKVTAADVNPDQITLKVEKKQGGKEEFQADVVLTSIGRKPYTQGLGLQNIGITPTSKGTIPIDGQFRTAVPNIYAIGDIVDGPMLAHKASEEGIAVSEIIAGHHPSIEYLAIPNIVYTDPEVASVGMTEAEAKNLGLSIKTGQFPFKANSRARCIAKEDGFVKIVAEEKTDRVIGVHILGQNASELIAEGVLAIQKKTTALELANTCHGHPTLSEAIKEAALALHKRPLHR